jgi:regulatory protein
MPVQGMAPPAIGGLSLKGRALKLLGAREHSRAELERKLATHESAPGELARVLDELQSRGFINERRVAESVVHRRAPRLGLARVRQELQAKGVPQDVLADTVAQLKATELDRAREVWRRKFGELPTDAAGRGKQMRFLVSRGFGAEVIHRVLAGAGDDN